MVDEATVNEGAGLPIPGTIEELKVIVIQAANSLNLDCALMQAIVEQESGWNRWAIRYEPAFMKKYVEPLSLPPTETVARSMSWGLFQLMGQGARELGFQGAIPGLLQPEVNAKYGCLLFAKKFNAAGKDVSRTLLLWNGGGNADYPKQVLARVARYK